MPAKDKNKKQSNEETVGAAGSSKHNAGGAAKQNQKIGGSSNDEILLGGPGNDKLEGGAGDDTINGGDGNDTIRGDGGNDTLAGDAGNDNVDGGDGDDLLVFAAALNVGAHDVYDGGDGNDTLRLILSAAQAADPAIQAEIAEYQAFIAQGGHGNGKGNGNSSVKGAFVFHTLGLTVRDIEALEIEVTGGSSNTAPVAGDDGFSVEEDSALALTANQLLANDTDGDGDSLSVTAVGNATNGSVALVGGNITFTPDTDFHGAASFEYTVVDGNGGSDTATVNITVNPVNDAPLAVNDSLNTDEDTVLNLSAGQLLANDSDVDVDTLTVSAVSNPVNGAVSLVAGAITFTPDPDFHGDASFDYTVVDGNGGSDTGTVNVTVNAVNDAPLAVDDSFDTDEDVALNLTALQLLGNDTDVDLDTLTVSAVGNPVNGSVSLVAGAITFTPDPDYYGDASFDYTVDDGNGGTDSGTVNITVNPINDAPVPADDDFATDEDAALNLSPAQLLGNDDDIEGDSLSISAAGNASNGSVSLVGGNIIFTPDTDFNGDASFEYTVDDGNGGSATGTVNITVNPVNDDPTALDDEFATDEDTNLTVSAAQLLVNDSDVDLDTLTLSAVSNPANGSVTLVAGAITFTPDPDFHGDASFDYTVVDGNGGSDTGTVNITVNPVNDAPLAVDDSFNTDEDVPLNLTALQLLGNDTDVDLDTLTVSAVSNPVNGVVSLVAGAITFTPDPDFNGDASFDYTVDDGNGGTDSGTVNITVGPVNDDPLATDDAFDVDENGVLHDSVATNDSDPEGDSLSFALDTGPANGALSLNPDGSFTYTPIPEFFGADGFTYTVSDGNGGVASASVDIDILRAADVPTQVIHEENVAEGETVIPLSIQSLLAGFVVTEVLSITIADVPAGASLNKGTDNLDGSYLLAPADLFGLAITLPGGTTGTVPLVVTTTADDGGPVSTQTATLNINFGAAGEAEIVTGLGGDRDDVITGGTANDYLSGGSGDDILQGNQGDDTIVGGAGSNDRARFNDFIQNYTITTNDGLDFTVTDNYIPTAAQDDGTDNLTGIEGLMSANFNGSFTGAPVGGAFQMTSGNDIAIAYGSNITVDYTGAVAGTAGININLSQAHIGAGVGIGTAQSGTDLLRGILNITGSEFDDTITGDDNDNVLAGGDGDDILQGNLGDDTIIGGAGSNDRARFNDFIQNYTITTNDGLDFTVTDNYIPTAAQDDGTDNLTEIEGLMSANFNGSFTGAPVGGAFQMTSGNDIAIAYGSNITVDYTGAVAGTAGININLSQAHIGAGVGIGTAQSGTDLLRGILNITGSQFDDTITGDDNDNVLAGGDGDDILQGNLGDDTIIGGAGSNDRARFNDFIQNYTITTSDGLDFTVTDNYIPTAAQDDGTDNLTEIEGLMSANFNGSFTGAPVGGAFQMTSGNDIAIAYGSNITVDYTGAVAGTAGININLSQAHIGAGVGIGTAQSGTDLLRGILNITGSQFDDTIIGDDNDNVLAGGDGNDILQGNQGDDTIVGGAGSNDRARFNDFIQNYTITTSDGLDFTVTDNYTPNPSQDDGTDNLTEIEGLMSANFNGSFTGAPVGGAFQMTSGDDIAIGYGANTTVDYTGAVAGTAGININLSQAHIGAGVGIGTAQSGTDLLRGILNITGSQFDDTITGDTLDNILQGGAGNDSLFGGNGDDTLIGGVGDDTMNGQSGNDLFVISDGDGNDKINAFVAGPGAGDRIDFSGVALIGDFNDVVNNVSQVGADAVIDYGTGSITLVGVNMTSFDADDFLF